MQAALIRQADLTRPWDTGWGVIVETAHLRELVPLPLMQKYASQAIDDVWASLPKRVSVRTVAEYNPGVSLYAPGLGTSRLGMAGMTCLITLTSAEIDGQPWPLDTSLLPMGEERSWDVAADRNGERRSRGKGLPSPPRLTPVAVAPGMHDVTFHFEVHATPCAKVWPASRGPAPQVSWTASNTTSFEVRAQGEPLSDPITNDEAIAELQRRMSVKVYNRSTTGRLDPVVALHVEVPTMNIAAKLQLRAGNQVWTANDKRIRLTRGSSVIDQAIQFTIPNMSEQLPEFAISPLAVNVVLQADDADAIACGFLASLGKSIVFKDVPVTLGYDGYAGSFTSRGIDPRAARFSLPPEPKPDPLPRPSVQPGANLTPPAPR